ncbi:hypothetical protein L596_020619 [Steinernema carpocapsae]|uniref:Uncharacterized protein n=1 Tax=Steinernema carpocapsae TaxID=34508 RepID=A0A4U5MU29_STECR|nr:hypothetical protein L596_020619 [Steinernema carpocapsae]
MYQINRVVLSACFIESVTRGGGSDRIGFSGFRIGFSDRIQVSDPGSGSDRIAFVRKTAFVANVFFARSFAKPLNLNIPQRAPATRKLTGSTNAKDAEAD